MPEEEEVKVTPQKKKEKPLQDSKKKKGEDGESEECSLKTNELVITPESDISELRLIEHKKLFPLLDYVENSKIERAEDLNYFESFFSVGNMSELSKSMTANMWKEYKEKVCEGGFSFKSSIYPGIKIRDS